jgi:flavin reductase (DIM6/NTAB) family NADH-FMN oxidoreductase RutF
MHVRRPLARLPAGRRREVSRLAKRPLGPIPYVYPIPIVLVGASVDGRPNYATVGDCAIAGIRPALVVVSLGETHQTTRGILEHGTFSVNVPRTADLPLVDYFGQVSGRDVDKSELVHSVFGDLETAPMIESCPVSLECRVRDQCSVEHRRIFIASVVQAHVDERYVGEDGKIAPLGELDPILYALDNSYYRIGPPIGVGYAEASKLRR